MERSPGWLRLGRQRPNAVAEVTTSPPWGLKTGESGFFCASRWRSARHVDFLDTEIAQVDQRIAADALSSPEVKRLMTVPGVNVIVAATFMAAVGDIRRFGGRRKLTAYLGLDPKVRQSGAGPANHGHISKQGPNSARHALVEACWSTVRQPGPDRRPSMSASGRAAGTRSRSSPARKLACLF